jgi:hypothetical protein
MSKTEPILDDWQREALNHKGDLLLCTGRQIGKTYILARKAAERMIKQEGVRIIIASLTEDQAKLIIVMILDFLEKHFPKIIAKGRNKPTQSKITLINKSYAMARPVGTTGDSLRGFTGDVLVLDEVSRFSELILTAAKPTLLATGGELWLASTPFGKGTKQKPNYFYQCFLNKNGRFKVIYKPTPTAIRERKINDYWTEEKREKVLKFLEEEQKEMSELQFGQEYLGLFLDDIRQFFDDELIAKTCILRRPEIYPKKNNCLGVDVARFGGDEITYEILNVRDEKIHQIENIVKKNQPTTQTEEDILHLNKIFNTEKIGIDAGSGALGVGIFDRLLKNVETRRRVVAMNNRMMSLDKNNKQKQKIFKQDMYENLLNLMEKGKIKLLNDDEVLMSLKSVQWELEGEKVRIFGSYTHIAEGLTRAAWLAEKEKINKPSISYI